MRSKLTTLLLVLGLVVSAGTAGVLASSDGGDSKRADSAQYQPGKGCGDPNRPHSGPPGNPDNTECPPQAGGPRKPASPTSSEAKAKRKAACAKKHPSKASKRRNCVKRGNAVANCKVKHAENAEKRANCIARAKKN